MITINNVTFGYNQKKDTLKNIDLTIGPGECLLLCGKSGCGKTTVTKLVNGLIPHFIENGRLEGTVTAAGLNVTATELYELAKSIASVFQNPKSQFFNLDSDAELAFGLENIGASPEYMRQRLDAVVRELDIERLMQRSIFAMSGGERQALAFGSAFAINPDIYVLDEPTANLDGDGVAVLKRQLGEIKRQGKTILIAEHRLYFLTDLIDRAVYMEDGEIVRIYPREEFFALSDEQRINMGLRTFSTPALNAAAGRKGEETLAVSAAPAGQNGQELSVRELCCEIKGKRVFDRISFSAGSGEIVGITGNNGVGKSTLMGCICGLTKEKSGSVSLGGKELTLRQRNRECFCVMQDVNHQLFSDSVGNECALSGAGRPEIEDVLKTFDLYTYKDSHPMALSGGQKQRLAIACGVLSHKKILVFDEPTSGLDYERMTAVAGLIRKLAEKGHIILIVTHDREFMNFVCDRSVSLTGKGREVEEPC
ncbi:ABC transporter ATP-binding protein [Desulfitobacterium chlororespirans]|uniref:Monosaccharide ABC transporter ATP-binding protein, CUT2 family (TC 3.A.1.2.-) n=1 Tax=Desulfitobacterium chlororespirans DSM 11544 TaxID=1121395 RepID=A0A1M7TVU1_9FIRM|nr:energy-coupling factor ABC transporter ATP-binding protein [Desulfitobacterium chlororespirans]SHN74821.1 monosaccharide ABC transporter ATP-binding protein, CUT2 family (TC 3.A.1.2.-) [Desulfitobacterium chlororespirans DSM 11544]